MPPEIFFDTIEMIVWYWLSGWEWRQTSWRYDRNIKPPSDNILLHQTRFFSLLMCTWSFMLVVKVSEFSRFPRALWNFCTLLFKCHRTKEAGSNISRTDLKLAWKRENGFSYRGRKCMQVEQISLARHGHGIALPFSYPHSSKLILWKAQPRQKFPLFPPTLSLWESRKLS